MKDFQPQEQQYGPTLGISEEIHAMKYRSTGETFKEAMTRVAEALKDDESHFNNFRTILYNQRFLPAGRVQSAMGAPRRVTPYNCFVSMTIEDSMDGIMEAARRAAETGRWYRLRLLYSSPTRSTHQVSGL
jgi:ribonucleoside-diphosphate reductase alpha chain